MDRFDRHGLRQVRKWNEWQLTIVHGKCRTIIVQTYYMDSTKTYRLTKQNANYIKSSP